MAKASKDAAQSRRFPALAEIYDGAKRTDAARLGDVGELQLIWSFELVLVLQASAIFAHH